MAGSTPLSPMIGRSAVPAVAGAPIRSPKTAELVAGTLRRMVVDGQLKEGDYLPNEAELMAHFGVSRPTRRSDSSTRTASSRYAVAHAPARGYGCPARRSWHARRGCCWSCPGRPSPT